MSKSLTVNRRQFLIGGTAAGGAFMLGLTATIPTSASGATSGEPVTMTTWIKITPDNRVIVINPHTEMGQGVMTSMPMMLAEELDADWNLIEVEQAPATSDFANSMLVNGFLNDSFKIPSILLGVTGFVARTLAVPAVQQITGGSTSVRFTGWHGLRQTGASAREMLVSAAAKKLGVNVSSLRTENSHVIHDATGTRLTYGELASAAANEDAPSNPRLKTADQYKIVGTRVARLDIPDKTNGSAEFGIDAQVDGMVYAAVKASPSFGGTVKSFDKVAAMAVKGVIDVVATTDAVAVIADRYWRAKKALDQMVIVFEDTPGFTNADLFALQAEAIKQDADEVHKTGDVEKGLASAKDLLEADYRVPFLNHATMEPMNCTAWLHDGQLEIWTGTQNPLKIRNACAEVAGLDEDKVTVHPMLLGGGFGRRSTDDYPTQAVRIAVQVNAPVKVIWSREEDMKHGAFRPSAISSFKGGITGNGYIAGWHNRCTGDDEPAEAPLFPYQVVHQDIARAEWENPVPQGPWRSVAHSQHGFFVESFVDELANLAGEDSYLFRRKHLDEGARDTAVLDLAADKSGWTQDLETTPGVRRGRGIAFQHSFGSRVAQVVEISVTEAGEITVDRVTTAIDCGQNINPDTIEAQMQSGVIYGLSAALYQEITLENGAVVEDNFPDFEAIRMQSTPKMDVHIINSTAAPGGVGEPGTPAVSPALANAVFAATGVRVRELPLSKADLSI